MDNWGGVCEKDGGGREDKDRGRLTLFQHLARGIAGKGLAP